MAEFDKELLRKYERMGNDEILLLQSQHDSLDKGELPYMVKELRRRKLSVKPELEGVASIEVPNRFPWWIWIVAFLAYKGIRNVIERFPN